MTDEFSITKDEAARVNTRLVVPWPVVPWHGHGGEISDMGGLGDALHWCRMVPYLAPHCPDVTIAVRRPLVRLFSRLGLPVVAYADVVPGNFSALASCLWAFLPPRVRLPPLHAMALPPLWCDDSVRLPEQDGCLRVGLCWHGSGGFSGDSRCVDDWRCVPPSALTPLLSLRGVAWIGLQLADHARELPIVGLDTLGVRDFADTAGVMRQLDLVITIDTSVAHLAGNLGLPTWLLLVARQHSGFDLRWDRSPPLSLYSTVRQFRQNAPGEWAPIVERVAAALEDLRRQASIRG